jgi:hypothetical protein
VDRVIEFPQSMHCTEKGTCPTLFAKVWRKVCKQKDGVDEEEEFEES